MGISVIIPVYNIEKYLSKCLDSVCAQGDCVREIIIVNDGSTDGSLNICEEYAKKNERIKIINKNNEGTSSAIVDGVNAATSEYIGFVDGDDHIEASMFCDMAECAERCNADIVICDYDSTDEHGNRFYTRDFGIEKEGLYTKNDGKFSFGILPTFSNGKYISGMRWNKLFKRELLIDNIAFEKNGLRIGEDMALVLSVAMSADSIAYVQKCLYHYLQRSNSAVHTYKRTNLDDWESVVKTLRRAASEYKYNADKIDESALCLLIQNCMSILHRSDLSRKQKKCEYKYIGDNETVRNLLSKVKIQGRFKRKLIFNLLKRKKYGLLATIY